MAERPAGGSRTPYDEFGEETLSSQMRNSVCHPDSGGKCRLANRLQSSIFFEVFFSCCRQAFFGDFPNRLTA